MGHFIEWKPFYSVGDPVIDGQHKRLLGIIDDLYLAIQTGDERNRVLGILERLAEYTTIHFDHEERVMQRCGYPDLENHKAMHVEMEHRVLDLRTHPNAIAGHELLRFLKNWWMAHIQNQDKAYSPYLSSIARSTDENLRHI
jgi:hemerythrin